MSRLPRTLSIAALAACSAQAPPATASPEPPRPTANGEHAKRPAVPPDQDPEATWGGSGSLAELRSDFHALAHAHAAIDRRVALRDDGVETWTTAESPKVRELLRRHVYSIRRHMSRGGHVRTWDPLFVALAEHADEMEMSIEPMPGGVHVIHRGLTPEAVALIRAHAEVISGFVARGQAEVRRAHEVPPAARGATPVEDDHRERCDPFEPCER